MVLATANPGNALCEVAGMRMLHRPTEAEKQQALDNLLAETHTTQYTFSTDHTALFGISYTAPALDLYAEAQLIRDTPVVVRYSDDTHYTLILLKPCGDC